MQFNIGVIDRSLRVSVGFVLICAALAGWIGPWGWLGLVPLLTGMVSYCPLYSWLGIRSNSGD